MKYGNAAAAACGAVIVAALPKSKHKRRNKMVRVKEWTVEGQHLELPSVNTGT